MGYKSKTRSMQRGALRNDNEKKLSKKEEYQQTKIVFSKSEKRQLGFNRDERDCFIKGIIPKLRLARDNNWYKPAEISKFFNSNHITTFVGEKWTPRLVHMLLGEEIKLPSRKYTQKTKQVIVDVPPQDFKKRLELLQKHFNNK